MLSRDAGAQDRPKELLHRSGGSAVTVSPCPGPLVAMESHEGEATAGREMQVGSGHGEVDFWGGRSVWVLPRPLFLRALDQCNSGQQLVTTTSPALQGTLRVSPAPSPRAFAAPSGAAVPTRPRYPPQALKIEAGALTHASHPPSKPAAETGAGGPVSPCRPQTGTTGRQQLLLLIYQPENNFSYITPGGRLGVPSRSRASHRIFAAPARIVPAGFIHRAPETQVPTAPGGSLCPSSSSSRFYSEPDGSGTYLHGGYSAGPPGATRRGLLGRGPAVAQSPAMHLLPWPGGTRQLTAAKFLGSSGEGREERNPPADPPGRAVPGVPRRVPQALGRSRWCGGIVDSGNLPELFTAFRAVMQTPPPRPRGGIFPRLQPRTLPVP